MNPQKPSSIDDMISFSKFFRMVLSKKYGEESKEIYAYYEKKQAYLSVTPK